MTAPWTRRRRTGAALLASGALCLATAALLASSAHADDDPGSGLGSFGLAANAPVLQAREDYAAQRCTATPAGTAGCEGVIGESVSMLSNGPVGYALSSVAWPGTLAGNLGSLLVTAGGGQVPPEATALNSPVRAESHIGGKNPVITDYPPAPAPPAAHMRADAEPAKVTAESVLGGAQTLPIGSLGTATSRTSTELTGVSKAVATAHSEVHDVTIGPLHLQGLVSDATATTNGARATAAGRTVVTGATIAGVPVSIDQNGVTVQAQKVPYPSQATDAVNAALANAKITIAVSQPNGTPSGGSVTYDAGSLVVVWEQQPDQVLTLVVGGAQVSVRSTAGLGCLFGCGPGGGTGGTTGAAAPPPATPPLTAPAPGTTGAPPPPSVTPPGPVLAPTNRAFAGRLPGGLSPWLGAMAVVGSLLVMAGLRRLPDRVLATSGSACPNGDLS